MTVLVWREAAVRRTLAHLREWRVGGFSKVRRPAEPTKRQQPGIMRSS